MLPTIPAEYEAFLVAYGASEGFTTGGGQPGYVALWRLDEIADNKSDIEIQECARGFVAFATDGGGEVLAFGALGAVFMLPLVGMEPSCAIKVAESFRELEARFERATRSLSIVRKPGANIVIQPRNAPLNEARSPLPDRLLGHLQPRGDRVVGLAVGTGQHKARATAQRRRQRTTTHERQKLRTFLVRQHQLGLRSASPHPGISFPKIPRRHARLMPGGHGTGH